MPGTQFVSLDDRLPIAVYGTLRYGQRNYERLLAGNTKGHVLGLLAPNHRMYGLSMPYPFATDCDRGRSIVVDVFYIKDNLYDDVVARLDHLEGFDPITNTGMYLRVARTVMNGDVSFTAWIYHASPAMLRAAIGPLIESGDWLNH